MRYIDFEGKTPANTPANRNFPRWVPWTQAKWDEWLQRSRDYQQELVRLHGSGTPDEIKARNAYIDSKSSHWGELKEWLRVLSHGKCWFSEAKELYSHYEVEHFRPKKEANGLTADSNRDGYWWLAFDYTNYRLCGNVGNRKKGGYFPLKEPSVISTYQVQCEESETFYFLDPTDPYDPLMLAFDEEGAAIASPDCKSDWERARANETIKRLKLTEHEALTEGRKRVWQKVKFESDAYDEALKKYVSGNNPGMRERVKAHLVTIKEMTSATSELSSVARWYLRFRNEGNLLRLID